jgi:cysteine desulfurase
LKRKRDDLERRMCAMTPGAEILGANATRLPNTTCITLPGVDAEVQVMALDLAGVLISSGSACSSGKVGPSHVLAAMGVAPEIAQTAIRISQGRMTTEQDLDRLLEAWAKLNLRSQDHKLDQGAVGL